MNKTIIGTVVALIVAIAGYLGYGGYQTLGVAYNETITKNLTATSTSQNVSAIPLKGKQNLTIAVVGTNATATVKFVGSINATEPDPISANSATNQWGYIDVVDLTGGTSLVGATGLSLESGTTTKMYKLTNVNLSYLIPIITSYTTGTVKVMLMSDEGSNK
jgi:hypothetical protein